MTLSDEGMKELLEILKDVQHELERQNDLKKKEILRNAAAEIKVHEPALARLIMEYVD